MTTDECRHCHRTIWRDTTLKHVWTHHWDRRCKCDGQSNYAEPKVPVTEDRLL